MQRETHTHACAMCHGAEAGGQIVEENAKGGGWKGEREKGVEAGSRRRHFFSCPRLEGALFFYLALGANSSCYDSGDKAGVRGRKWAHSLEWREK